jgi:Fanconi anemia group M protein
MLGLSTTTCHCAVRRALLLQCLQNDLKKGTCPAHQLVCLVVDECHRATGDAAMAKSLQLLRERRAHFRVLGLSATPGNAHDKIKVRLAAMLLLFVPAFVL